MMDQWIFSASRFREVFFYAAMGVLYYVVIRCWIASRNKDEQLAKKIKTASLILGISTLLILKFDLLALVASIALVFYLTFLQSKNNQGKISNYGRKISIGVAACCGLFLWSGNLVVLGYGPSMWPAVPRGYSLAIIESGNSAKKIYRGSEIAFTVRGNDVGKDEDLDWMGGQYHKRVVGLPGDTIEISPYTMTVNGIVVADCHPGANTTPRTDYKFTWTCPAVLMDESANKKTHYTISWGEPDIWMSGFDKVDVWKVKEGELFVVGDNLIESGDSRDRGVIQQKWVSGRYY